MRRFVEKIMEKFISKTESLAGHVNQMVEGDLVRNVKLKVTY